MHSLGRQLAVTAALALGGATACDEVDRRTLRLERVVPVGAEDCGQAADGRAVLVSALGDFPVSETTARFVPAEGPEVAIEQFPADTRVLEVTVLGPGAAVSTAGRTAAFALDELPDGAALPLFMAPLRGVCPTGPMNAARRDALLARAGTGVLVAGGLDAAAAPVASVELYRPELGAFVDIAPTTYASGPFGLVGASLTTLVDGRVVLAGGPDQGFAVYDPDAGAFSSALFLPTRRAFHAAAALADGRLLLAGGCGDLDASGSCEGATALTDTVLIDVDTGEQTPGPPLAGARIGGQAVVEDDGRVLVVGGVDGIGAAVTRAERIDPLGGGASQGVANVAGSAARLTSGATLVAFASGGAAASRDVSAIAPGGSAASRLEAAPVARADAALVPLDDGSVLAIGGADAGDALALFEPIAGTFTALPAAPIALPRRASRAVRLDDGTVLIAGGADDQGDAIDAAFVYRHDLTHGFSSRLQAVVADPALSFALSPGDPARVRRVPASGDINAHVRLEGVDGPLDEVDSYVVGGGPRFADVTVEARAVVESGGIAVLFGFRSAVDYLAVILQPDSPATLRRVASGRGELLCQGTAAVTADQLADLTLRVDARGTTVRASIAAGQLLDCNLDNPSPRGAVGLGTVGPATATTRLERLTATR